MGARPISRILLGALAAAALAGVTGTVATADGAGSSLRLPVSQDPLAMVNRIVAEVQRRANPRAVAGPVQAARAGSTNGVASQATGTALNQSAAARARACAAEDRAEARRDATEDRIERELQRLDRIEDRIEARHARAEDRAEQALMRAQARVHALSDRLAAGACAT